MIGATGILPTAGHRYGIGIRSAGGLLEPIGGTSSNHVLEDPFAEVDFDSWREFHEVRRDGCRVFADNFTSTNPPS